MPFAQPTAEILEDVAARLREYADRSDPGVETVLCLVECAAHAARATSRGQSACEADLLEALAAARAAVGCAKFAVAEARPTARPSAAR
ncbi:hypothetical protein HNR23_005183 [Nocardiopsis mwathae]|uniref:Uncharacterized protein n=1 Tax=Nocardiopsis mwathae TaxID=1472723 RepID=A0A7W9YMW6_9ACTN|nr:hypothetical protein [Nocardiopsis mwathae]MBB6175123.1 hypothetical protein [Nocardiopsis mwathae]